MEEPSEGGCLIIKNWNGMFFQDQKKESNVKNGKDLELSNICLEYNIIEAETRHENPTRGWGTAEFFDHSSSNS